VGQEKKGRGKMKLTDTACKNAKPRDRAYKMFDGGGLYLEVMPNGSKLWRVKYRYLGKERRLSLGAYPLITLAEAREGREEIKKLLAKDIDPATAKLERKREIVRNVENTFQAVALEWLEIQKSRVSEGYVQAIQKRLENNIFPYLGSRPIAQITPPELLEVLRKIEKRGKLETTSRLKQLCGQIFRYGIQTGKCERDAAADLKGALKTKKTEHFRTIDAKDIPAFIAALEKNEARLYARTRRAIWLSMLTFCRPGEIRQARWEEIDFEEAIWAIPGSKMKMGRDHIVPLSKQAVAILREQQEETGALNTPWVFPSQIKPRQCMSDGTVVRAIDRLGFGEKMVAHGFRALARTTIREKLGYDSEVIERQLAHKASGPLGMAYDRTEFLDKRKKMMQEWANFLEAVASQGKVISLTEKRKRA